MDLTLGSNEISASLHDTLLCDSIALVNILHCICISEMLKGLVKATVPVVKLGVKVGLCGGAVYVTKEVAANLF